MMDVVKGKQCLDCGSLWLLDRSQCTCGSRNFDPRPYWRGGRQLMITPAPYMTKVDLKRTMKLPPFNRDEIGNN